MDICRFFEEIAERLKNFEKSNCSENDFSNIYILM